MQIFHYLIGLEDIGMDLMVLVDLGFGGIIGYGFGFAFLQFLFV